MATRVPQTRAGRDIARLQSQFEKQMLELNERQSKAFAEYTKQTSATMAPYESQMASYTGTLLPEYERQIKDYNAALKAYQDQVAAELAKTVDYSAPTQYREVATTPAASSASPFMFGGFMNAPIMGGPTEGTTFEAVPIYDVPKFSKTAPVMPEAPQAPALAAFDTAQYEAEASQLQERLQRELGARRGSRLAAVRRQPRSGLMAGV